VTVFVTTHYLDEAEHCHRLALMDAGEIVALGTVSRLKEVFTGWAVLEVTCPRPLEALDLFAGESWVREISLFGTRLHVVVEEAREGRRRVLGLLEEKGFSPASAQPIVPSLEDVFIHHIERRREVSGVGPGAGEGGR
jgi:ABC-2 type transport system ATP-binding protein